MIQIEDWVVIAGILAFFFAGISYLIYFRITRKLSYGDGISEGN